ncbi:DUF4527 domain-containing protein [Nonomuraea gerenzanensis]|uniref:DUF4527 domain-containing protein n=1 Tax=Nonomuraea gerenzanensis TaxID=93944 RepID=UPI001CD95404|nr:DUF4527 domain-containing protein [Nonomuraea gerenzanensis]UBU18009.1 DUF4527 domain-containing protein [Nonomuraea gerenzanensis]
MTNAILTPRISGKIVKIAAAVATFGSAFGLGAGALDLVADRGADAVLADPNTWPVPATAPDPNTWPRVVAANTWPAPVAVPDPNTWPVPVAAPDPNTWPSA